MADSIIFSILILLVIGAVAGFITLESFFSVKSSGQNLLDEHCRLQPTSPICEGGKTVTVGDIDTKIASKGSF